MARGFLIELGTRVRTRRAHTGVTTMRGNGRAAVRQIPEDASPSPQFRPFLPPRATHERDGLAELGASVTGTIWDRLTWNRPRGAARERMGPPKAAKQVRTRPYLHGHTLRKYVGCANRGHDVPPPTMTTSYSSKSYSSSRPPMRLAALAGSPNGFAAPLLAYR